MPRGGLQHSRQTWTALEESLLKPTSLLCVKRPFTPVRTGSLMLSDGMSAPWSTSWSPDPTQRPARGRSTFAETFAALVFAFWLLRLIPCVPAHCAAFLCSCPDNWLWPRMR